MKTTMRLAFERAKVTKDAASSPLVSTCLSVMRSQDRKAAAVRKAKRKAARDRSPTGSV